MDARCSCDKPEDSLVQDLEELHLADQDQELRVGDQIFKKNGFIYLQDSASKILG